MYYLIPRKQLSRKIKIIKHKYSKVKSRRQKGGSLFNYVTKASKVQIHTFLNRIDVENDSQKSKFIIHKANTAILKNEISNWQFFTKCANELFGSYEKYGHIDYINSTVGEILYHMIYQHPLIIRHDDSIFGDKNMLSFITTIICDSGVSPFKFNNTFKCLNTPAALLDPANKISETNISSGTINYGLINILKVILWKK